MYQNAIPVLAYHDIIDDGNHIDDIHVSVKNFEKQMRFLSKNNFDSLSINDFYDWKKGNKVFSGKKVLITFDDGFESFYTKAVPILEKYGLKATVFVIDSKKNYSNYLSQLQIDDIKINHKEFDVESHSYDLHHRDALDFNYDLYNRDLLKTKMNKYNYYAYPFGKENNDYIKALKNNKYKLAFKYAPSKWSTREQNDYQVTRVPIYNSTSFIKFMFKVLLCI